MDGGFGSNPAFQEEWRGRGRGGGREGRKGPKRLKLDTQESSIMQQFRMHIHVSRTEQFLDNMANSPRHKAEVQNLER